MNKTVTIIEPREAAFLKLVEATNKRLKPFGGGVVTVTELGESVVESESGRFPAKEYLIGIPETEVSEWAVTGRLEHIKDEHSLVFGEVPASFRELGPVCQHCGTNRRRKLTYLVVNANTKRRMLVGKGCMTEVTGSVSGEQLLRQFDVLMQFQEALEAAAKTDAASLSDVPPYIEALYALGVTVDTIERFGWVPRTGAASWQETTAARVQSFIDARHVPSPKGMAHAKEVLNWALSEEVQDRAVKGSYLHNLHAVAQAGCLPAHRLPIWASAVVAYKKSLQAKIEKEVAVRPSVPVGTLGERLETSVTVVRFAETVGHFGVSTVVSMQDDDGNDFVWFSTGYCPMRPGGHYRITGRVEKHAMFRNRWQTRLSRVTVLDMKLLELAEKGDVKALKKALAKGNLDVNIRDSRGATPLILAAASGAREVFALLVAAGADESLTDNYGHDAAHYLAELSEAADEVMKRAA